MTPPPPLVNQSEIVYLSLLTVKIYIFAFLQKCKNANVLMSSLDPNPQSDSNGNSVSITIGCKDLYFCISTEIQKCKVLIVIDLYACFRINLSVVVSTYRPSAATLGLVSLGFPVPVFTYPPSAITLG